MYVCIRINYSIDASPDHKASGFDGLPAEVYKAFQDIHWPALIEVFLSGLHHVLITTSMLAYSSLPSRQKR